jgi:hypothetical protein
MKRLIQIKSLRASALVFTLAGVFALACGDDSNDGPSKPPPVGEDSGVTSSDKSDDSETSDAGADDSKPAADDTTDDNDSSDDTTSDDTGNADDKPAADKPEPSADDEPTSDAGTHSPEPSTEDGGSEPTAPSDETDASVTITDDDVPVVSTDGGTTDLDAGSEPPPGPECVENADECISCPTTNEQFLHQCTSSDCAPFDNEARLGKYEPGEPLPEVP